MRESRIEDRESRSKEFLKTPNEVRGNDLFLEETTMGPLQLAVTWYKIHHAGEQATHWDVQNKENGNLS